MASKPPAPAATKPPTREEAERAGQTDLEQAARAQSTPPDDNSPEHLEQAKHNATGQGPGKDGPPAPASDHPADRSGVPAFPTTDDPEQAGTTVNPTGKAHTQDGGGRTRPRKVRDRDGRVVVQTLLPGAIDVKDAVKRDRDNGRAGLFREVRDAMYSAHMQNGHPELIARIEHAIADAEGDAEDQAQGSDGKPTTTTKDAQSPQRPAAS
jgi:hypothetical protein